MDYSEIKEKMSKTISVYSENLSEIRAGRANPAILNKIKVDYYGVPTPISQVAGISVPEARLIVIQPWDTGILKEIEKEILKSDIGINPNNDGKVIRLAFPELNEERRKEIVKDIKKLAEDAKVAIRAIRRDAIDGFRKQEQFACRSKRWWAGCLFRKNQEVSRFDRWRRATFAYSLYISGAQNEKYGVLANKNGGL